MGLVYFFAYGSCMDVDSFSRTVGAGNFEIVGAAVLKDYRLVFNLYSDFRGGGVADIVSHPGEQVEGVLYRLKPEALDPLDQREGVDRGIYRRMTVTVFHQRQPVKTMTYTVVNKEQKDLAPSQEYAQLIYNGAVQQLSDSYRKKLVHDWKQNFGLDFFGRLEEKRDHQG